MCHYISPGLTWIYTSEQKIQGTEMKMEMCDRDRQIEGLPWTKLLSVRLCRLTNRLEKVICMKFD